MRHAARLRHRSTQRCFLPRVKSVRQGNLLVDQSCFQFPLRHRSSSIHVFSFCRPRVIRAETVPFAARRRPDVFRLARRNRPVKQRRVVAGQLALAPPEHLVARVDRDAHQPWPNGFPTAQRVDVRVGAGRRVRHGFFRVAVRAEHHPRHAKHARAVLTNRLDEALVPPSFLLHNHPSFRFLRIAIHL